MSAFILNQKNIEVLTAATDAALRMNKKYPGSYYLHSDTQELLGKYADDLHNLYRALYITNIKAVNGRYGEDQKTLPRYQPIMAWDISRIDTGRLRKACGLYDCYLYQCSEDPIFGSKIYNAFNDIHKLLCTILVSKIVDWDGNPV